MKHLLWLTKLQIEQTLILSVYSTDVAWCLRNHVIWSRTSENTMVTNRLYARYAWCFSRTQLIWRLIWILCISLTKNRPRYTKRIRYCKLSYWEDCHLKINRSFKTFGQSNFTKNIYSKIFMTKTESKIKNKFNKNILYISSLFMFFYFFFFFLKFEKWNFAF